MHPPLHRFMGRHLPLHKLMGRRLPLTRLAHRPKLIMAATLGLVFKMLIRTGRPRLIDEMIQLHLTRTDTQGEPQINWMTYGMVEPWTVSE